MEKAQRFAILRGLRNTRHLRPGVVKQLVSRYSKMVKPLTETNSFAMNVFRGKLNVNEVLPFPKALTSERLQNLQDIVTPLEKFIETEVDAVKHDAEGKFDEKLSRVLSDMGAYGLQAPEEYQGLGLGNSEYARLVNIIGQSDLALGIHLGAHQSIGYKGIVLYGTESQKAKYLPDLTTGKTIAAYCLTEPGSGSDAASVQTTAKLSPDGKHYILNGTKIWISNGGLAKIFTVFAKTPVTDEDGKTTDKVTAFIVERDFGGVTHSQPEEKMGIHASNTTALYFDDCKVPVENVLGQVGDGFKIAVNILNQGRFGMAAALSGTMRAAIQKTAQYVVQRKQFGRALNEFQNVQEKLANMTMRQYVAESMAFMIAGTMDLGAQDFQVEAAISKVYSSEAAWYCVDEAIQLHGGTGYMKHANLERVLRDLRVFRIFEGANDVLRLFIALTGLRYAGKHLAAARKSPVGIVRLGTQRLKQNFGFGAGHTLSNLVPASLISVGEELGDAIDLFGEECMLLLRKHGKDVIEEQFRLIRLADAIVEVYAMMCAVSRAAMAIQEHSQFAEHEVHLTNVVCQNGIKKIHECFSELDASYDKRLYNSFKSISFDVCNHGGVPYHTPLGI
ncbi:Very long-chain specific acyl-CoA dehydrogenase, mitochondrial [Clonorchis sinensis]|uniref:Very long-chain specific acyl-CoA dehydrogenase, mitochondrial n=1 Tax=Clonorchis sinensis TaxID=79923 RepID=A0A8T1MDJ3_CLOSI|nr:Very long-chain specific acyl-CoA dehydrogenase, mitochondrial [Clonorchis sinensis]